MTDSLLVKDLVIVNWWKMKDLVNELGFATTIRTNVKFRPNAGFGPKTNSDQKFKFGPKYSGN